MKISPKQYAKLLFEIRESANSVEDAQEQVSKVSRFMLKNRDQRKTKKIEQEYENILFSKGKKLAVVVESAHGLKELQTDQIKHAIAEEKNVAEDVVTIESRVNKKMIGGLKIMIGDEIIDQSLLSRIEMLRNSLAK